MLDAGVGKSEHSMVPKSQLCFAQVTHPKGVFITPCQDLGRFGASACGNGKLEELWWGFGQPVPRGVHPLCVGRCFRGT